MKFTLDYATKLLACITAINFVGRMFAVPKNLSGKSNVGTQQAGATTIR